MSEYPERPERVVKIEQFYTYDPGRDEFNVRDFWVDVARDAVRRVKRRESRWRAAAGRGGGRAHKGAGARRGRATVDCQRRRARAAGSARASGRRTGGHP